MTVGYTVYSISNHIVLSPGSASQLGPLSLLLEPTARTPRCSCLTSCFTPHQFPARASKSTKTDIFKTACDDELLSEHMLLLALPRADHKEVRAYIGILPQKFLVGY